MPELLPYTQGKRSKIHREPKQPEKKHCNQERWCCNSSLGGVILKIAQQWVVILSFTPAQSWWKDILKGLLWNSNLSWRKGSSVNNDRSQKSGECNSHTYVAHAMAFAQSIFSASFWKFFPTKWKHCSLHVHIHRMIITKRKSNCIQN